MKRILSVLFLAALAVAPLAAAASHDAWTADFDAAKKTAKADGKKILMLFTGSDWCPTCIQWEKEAISDPAFREFAKKTFVPVLVDFPQKRKLPKAQARANDALLDKYKLEVYPTIVIADEKGKKLEEIRYIEGGAKPLIAHLEKAK